MNIKKRNIHILFFVFVLIVGIFIVNAAVDKTKAWHGSNEIRLRINGSEMTLQSAINQNLLNGTYSYAAPSSITNPGHNISEIWVSVNGVESTLLTALSTTGICGDSPTNSYSSPNILAYQYANQINVSVQDIEMSLQDAIDNSKFCCSWSNGTCTGTRCVDSTRIISCKCRGVTVADSYCPASTKPPTNCPCWPGYGCGACPFGATTTNCRADGVRWTVTFCNLNGMYGRSKYYHDSDEYSWGDWRTSNACFETMAWTFGGYGAICSARVTSGTIITYFDWQIAP